MLEKCLKCRYKDRNKTVFPCDKCLDEDLNERPITCDDCRQGWFEHCKKGIRPCKKLEKEFGGLI